MAMVDVNDSSLRADSQPIGWLRLMMSTGNHLMLSLHSSDYSHGDSTINVDIGSIIVVIIYGRPM